jgi:hypothetical protein
MGAYHQVESMLGLASTREYATDALQRSVLFCDVLRQRSQEYYRHKAMVVPHVLNFGLEMVLAAGVAIDPLKRPPP